jgi:CRP/FNR family transcriptional regulator, cyclic AMP receptor protein
MATLESLVRESLWAAALSAEELDQVLRETFERRIPTGGYAVRRGEPAEIWFGVIEGLIKMSVSQPDGRVSTFTGVTAGGWAGEGSLLKPGRWRYDGIAARDTRAACVPRHTFERLVSTNIAFNRFLLGQLNARLSLFVGLVEFDRLLGPDARVARCLASLFDPDLYPRAGDFVQLNQEEVGLLAAVSRQRANEALHELERVGLLRVEFGGVTLLDLPGLRRYVGKTEPRPSGRLRAVSSGRPPRRVA